MGRGRWVDHRAKIDGVLARGNGWDVSNHWDISRSGEMKGTGYIYRRRTRSIIRFVRASVRRRDRAGLIGRTYAGIEGNDNDDDDNRLFKVDPVCLSFCHGSNSRNDVEAMIVSWHTFNIHIVTCAINYKSLFACRFPPFLDFWSSSPDDIELVASSSQSTGGSLSFPWSPLGRRRHALSPSFSVFAFRPLLAISAFPL